MFTSTIPCITATEIPVSLREMMSYLAGTDYPFPFLIVPAAYLLFLWIQ